MGMARSGSNVEPRVVMALPLIGLSIPGGTQNTRDRRLRRKNQNLATNLALKAMRPTMFLSESD
jgi:hypothetical protein